MIKAKRVYPLVILALIFLFNPNVNLIDVLPDCIAYILLILVIGAYAETVPYLAECKGAGIKLALVTLIKIPAFSVMSSNMASGKDIVPLFTLVFAVLEMILLYSMLDNGFKALEYIGERTDCASVITPFALKNGKAFTPEALKILTLIFFMAKGILSVIPELFLLTPEDASLRKKLTEAYPGVIVISVLTALVIGAIWLYHALKYVKSIKSADEFGIALESLAVKGSIDEINTMDMLKRFNSALTVLAFSSIFIFDVAFSDFGGYNKLPHFIYGILIFISVYNLSNRKELKLCSIVGVAGFSISSLLVHLFTARFFETYTYLNLPFSVSARSAYLPIKVFGVIETVFAIIMLVNAALITVDFIRNHTDVSPSDASYNETNRQIHKTTMKKALPLFALSIVISVLKCANIFIKQSSTLIYSEVNPDGIAASGVPAMDTVIFFVCLVYVIYSFVCVSGLKEEIKFKYGKE